VIGNAPASTPPRKGVYKGRPVTFDRARIVSLCKEGMGATEIANAVGCKRGNVYKTLKAAGLN
jgi:DNA invertase Pin-like site-specific DNA recombinase